MKKKKLETKFIIRRIIALLIPILILVTIFVIIPNKRAWDEFGNKETGAFSKHTKMLELDTDDLGYPYFVNDKKWVRRHYEVYTDGDSVYYDVYVPSSGSGDETQVEQETTIEQKDLVKINIFFKDNMDKLKQDDNDNATWTIKYYGPNGDLNKTFTGHIEEKVKDIIFIINKYFELRRG